MIDPKHQCNLLHGSPLHTEHEGGTMTKRSRRRGTRAALICWAVVAVASLLSFAGTGSAASSAVPSNTASPSISGTEQEGQVLTADHGDWSDSPTGYDYQWQRCNSGGSGCSDISGATGDQYTLGSADVGNRVRVGVSATNGEGTSGFAYAAPTGVIAAAGTAPTNTSLPTISGTAQDNQTLTASEGSWNGSTPITYAYQWRRCDSNGNSCSDIATGQTYRVSSNDVGHRLRVAVTATNSVGSGSAVSDATDVATAAGTAPTNTSLPTISGTAQDNQTLTASQGSWNGSTPITYAYQWRRCDTSGNNCGNIATGQAYKVTSNDVGHRLRVSVTATNSFGSGSAVSAPTAIALAAGIAPRNTAPPKITGTTQDNQTLIATGGTWTGNAPITYGYQWQRCDANGNGCQSIGGATAPTYKATSADVGHRLRVAVTGRNAYGSSTATSAATSPVTAAAPAGCPGGTGPVSVANLGPPARLLIDAQQASPSVVHRGTRQLIVRYHVSACGGRPVEGALVYGTAIPYNQLSIPPEQRTNSSGWTELGFRMLSGFPVSSKQQLIAIFVRARKPGENILGGISTRRLFSVHVNLHA
jgi:hypothetical protein